MSGTSDSRDSLLRSAWSWTPLPFIAWFLSIPFLGIGAFFIPAIVAYAPLGLIGYFQEISLRPTPDQKAAIVAIHGGFWFLFITGVALRRLLPLFCLRVIWIIVIAALFMSISGCAAQLGEGLRNDGSWH